MESIIEYHRKFIKIFPKTGRTSIRHTSLAIFFSNEFQFCYQCLAKFWWARSTLRKSNLIVGLFFVNAKAIFMLGIAPRCLQLIIFFEILNIFFITNNFLKLIFNRSFFYLSLFKLILSAILSSYFQNIISLGPISINYK